MSTSQVPQATRRLLTIKEAAAHVGVSEKTIRRWIADEDDGLRAYRRKRVIRVRIEDLQRFLDGW